MSARSRTGCLTCRQRKLKCDEVFREGRCKHCFKSNRKCVRGSGIVFRNQQNPSLNHEGDGSLDGFYTYRDTFDKDSIWVKIPKRVSFIAVDPTVEEDDIMDMAEQAMSASTPTRSSNGSPSNNTHSLHGLDTLSVLASAGWQKQLDDDTVGAPSFVPLDSAFQEETTPATHIESPPPNVSMLLSPTSAMVSNTTGFDFIINPSPAMTTSTEQTYVSRMAGSSPLELGSDAVTEYEIAFLVRHFSEGPAQWMDLYDLGSFFAHYLPAKATTSALLKYSAAAFAAKQLGCAKGRKPIVGGGCSTQASMELYLQSSSIDWLYRAVQLYDKALSLLAAALNEGQFGRDSGVEIVRSISQDEVDDPRRDILLQSSKPLGVGTGPIDDQSLKINPSDGGAPDDLIAATAILCAYEFIDASGSAWSRHLDGAKSLLDIAESHTVQLLQFPLSSPRPAISKAKKATFWNLARQDLMSSLITEKQTRLDSEDLLLWRGAGLFIDHDGFLEPSNTASSGYAEGDDVMKEDMLGNALVWLLSKLVNYGVAADFPPITGRETDEWEGIRQVTGINQATIHQRWNELKRQFDVWYAGLPITYIPCAIIQPQDRVEDCVGATTRIPEAWYTIPMCASTMQSYHMAQIILLINRPQQSTFIQTNTFERLGSYRAISARIERHAKAICSISLSRPNAAVRVHSVEPLYYAGQCLEDSAERTMILTLLREIEEDLGWSTSYRVKQLMQLWGWEEA